MDRHKVLVVDHDKDTAHYVCSCLEKAGYDTLQAHDGETALQAIRREKPDLARLSFSESLIELTGTPSFLNYFTCCERTVGNARPFYYSGGRIWGAAGL